MAGRKSPKKNLLSFIVSTIDKAFYHVYDGEPLKSKIRTSTQDSILEEEVLFCKNNVCVHSVLGENFEDEHSLGYLCIKKIYRADSEISDMMLSWTPNTLLSTGYTDLGELVTDESIEDRNLNNQSHDNEIEINEINQEIKETSKDSLSLSLNSSMNFETPLGEVFSINILDVKTLKLFFANELKDSGQFVIGTYENEYKVFHFHNTGLIKLANIFESWNGCSDDKDLDPNETMQQVFYIHSGREGIINVECQVHPEEFKYKALNTLRWQSYINSAGQLEDAYNFRKHVFFGGVSQDVRVDAWKFLLYYYPMHSTSSEREILKIEKQKAYEAIHAKRLALSSEEFQVFWRKVQFIVDKDVVRTDRLHPYYAGQDNPNLQIMRNLLLNYAIYNPVISYTQGMSDLVAPLLATLHNEVDTFWCFVGLMEASMFVATPTDSSMEVSLNYLRELLRIMLPDFYLHFLGQDYEMDLLFAHRWLVLCFKREFLYQEVLKIWEACWSRYQTDYFHIFVCVAIVKLYGFFCIERKLNSDEILQYFTEMAMKFDGTATLKEARFLLYKFRQMAKIPCSLLGLLSGKGVWDGGISPEIECVSHHKKCCIQVFQDNQIENKESTELDNQSVKIKEVKKNENEIT
ncbi:TBC1 domain family member 16-like isoform X5 [Hydra vulgaris]|uniref:TBC1 domain family member 16-like isoform X5 n=1 Tax=Hydra vulgaris TaxID=6087 RepID=A0ABM4CCC8_HYDVU